MDDPWTDICSPTPCRLRQLPGSPVWAADAGQILSVAVQSVILLSTASAEGHGIQPSTAVFVGNEVLSAQIEVAFRVMLQSAPYRIAPGHELVQTKCKKWIPLLVAGFRCGHQELLDLFRSAAFTSTPVGSWSFRQQTSKAHGAPF